MSAPAPHNRPPPARRKGSLLRSLLAVAWSLFGVRQGAQYQQDQEKVQLLHIVFVGVAAIFVLVLALMVLVNWVV